MSGSVPDILQRILLRKQQEIAERTAITPMEDIQVLAADAQPVRGFIKAIEKKLEYDHPAVIAEIKKASPSKGVLREDFNPVEIAQSYAKHGAACLSVLTDADFFQGNEEYLQQARASCKLPVIRKDFIIDPYQVIEARAINADCILLIVAALEEERLNKLLRLAHKLDMDVLMEVHDREEMQIAIDSGARLIGINNRNLRTFETRLDTTLDMLDMVPEDRILVTESGIHAAEDVQLMRDNGVHSFLVGEAFMRATDPGKMLASLFAANQ